MKCAKCFVRTGRTAGACRDGSQLVAPTNVPYVVDNLWEWRRPDGWPSRRHCVCASPKFELAQQAAAATEGRVFRVKVGREAKVAQIVESDARYHRDVKELRRTLLQLLGQNWLDGPAQSKSESALLWTPCLTRDEVAELFQQGPLARIRCDIWDAIRFWDGARLVSAGEPWPFSEGEIFFEAEEWELVACQTGGEPKTT